MQVHDIHASLGLGATTVSVSSFSGHASQRRRFLFNCNIAAQSVEIAFLYVVKSKPKRYVY